MSSYANSCGITVKNVYKTIRQQLLLKQKVVSLSGLVKFTVIGIQVRDHCTRRILTNVI